MLNSKRVFDMLFQLNLLVALIVLVIMVISYYYNSDKVFENTRNQRKIISLIYRDTNIEYLNKKFRLLLEDGIFMLKAYENIEKAIDGGSLSDEVNSAIDNLENNKCIIHGSLLNKDDHGAIWGNGDDINEIIKNRFGGFFLVPEGDTKKEYNSLNKEEQKILQKCCILQNLIDKIFYKYFSWKDRTYITVEFIYFTFYNGVFYKYPKVYSPSAFEYKEDTVYQYCGYSNSKNKYYEPRCRPFYINAIDSNTKITLTNPYMFQSGAYGNDVCIKSIKESTAKKLGKTVYLPNTVLCFAFNFLDYQLFRKSIQSTLKGTHTKIYLVYYDSSAKSLKVVFNSDYKQDELKCNVKDKTCEAIDFFNVFYKKELDELYDFVQNQERGEEIYLDQYETLKEYYVEVIKNEILQIAEILPRELLEITIEDVLKGNPGSESFQFTVSLSVEVVDDHFEFGVSENPQSFYIFPLIGGFDYDYKDGNYVLKEANNYNYYIITVEGSEIIGNSDKSFKKVILIEFFLFSVLLVFIDILVWFIFLVFYSYFYYGIFFPLNIIVKLYVVLGKTTVNKSYIKKFRKKLCQAKQDSISILNFRDCVVNWVHKLVSIDDFEDIRVALLSLQAVHQIIIFKDKKILGFHAKKQKKPLLKIETFIDAIGFLVEGFFLEHNHTASTDYPVIALIIENVFISIILNLKNKPNDVEEFYNMISGSVRKKKKSLDVEMKQSISLAKEAFYKKFYEPIKILEELEDNLYYIFYSYKVNCFKFQKNFSEQKEENTLLSKYNPDEEEMKCLKALKKKAELQMKEMKHKNANKNILEALNSKKEKTSIVSSFDEIINEEEEGSITELIDKLEIYLAMNNASSNEELSRFCFEEIEEDPVRNLRIYKLIQLFRSVSAICKLIQLYAFVNDNKKGLAYFDEVFYLVKKLENIIFKEIPDSYYGNRKASAFSISNKEFNQISRLKKWPLTSYALLTCEIIIFEKLLYLMTIFQKKYGQAKNEVFLFLNILDLGPIYTGETRKKIVNKLFIYVKEAQEKYLRAPEINLKGVKQLLLDNSEYIDLQRSLVKLTSLRNSTRSVRKKCLFLFDVDISFNKDDIFKEILLSQLVRSSSFEDLEFYYSFFSKTLHILSRTNFKLISMNEEKFVRNFMVNIPTDNVEPTDNMTQAKKDEFNYFFEKLHEAYEKSLRKKTQKKVTYRADKALYHAVTFGITHNRTVFYRPRDEEESRKVKIKYSSYLIMFTNIKSTFTNNKKNWEEIAKMVFKQRMTLIIVITVDSNISEKETKEKISNYKSFLNNYVIDGYLFIMHNFRMLKVILNSIFPTHFSEFEIKTMEYYLESVSLINQSNNSV